MKMNFENLYEGLPQEEMKDKEPSVDEHYRTDQELSSVQEIGSKYHNQNQIKVLMKYKPTDKARLPRGAQTQRVST